MKHLILVLLIILLSVGCSGPKSKQASLDKKALPCLKDQESFEIAMSCLRDNGYTKWKEYKSTYVYDSCGMYWGYPLVASCSYIFIEHEGDKIKSYNLEAALDGV